MFPVIRVPISRKIVLGFVAAAIVTVLQWAGVYETSEEVAGLLASGSYLLVSWAVPEGVKFLDYAAERLGLKVIDFEDAP